MTRELDRLVDSAALCPLDRHFAAALLRLEPAAAPEVLLAAALASRAVQRGHVCLDLARVCQDGWRDEDGQPHELVLPPLADWREALRASALCGDGTGRAPLQLCQERLYLHRYFDYEERLARALLQRADWAEPIDHERARAGLDRLFGTGPEPNAQKLAAAIALTRRFALVSGGPGTGKTTTVAKILALLQELAFASRGAPLRVMLAAPTGKAAQRLGEALRAGMRELPLDPAIAATLALEAKTIHRMLGVRMRQPTRFRHGLEQPLAADVVVVDEASMVDLALMTKLVEAVPPAARLILLGDRDQLASVEAGAILGDLYDADADPRYSAELARVASELTGQQVPEGTPPGIRDCMVQLAKSYRYSERGGIGALARAVKAGDTALALTLLRGGGDLPLGDLSLASLDEKDPLEGTLGRTVVDAFLQVLQAADPALRLARLGRFRVLCAHRRGPLGSEAVGRAVERRLKSEGLVRGDGAFYDGRPILIVRNDYPLELFNGDIGVVCNGGGRTRVVFPGPDGVRELAPSRLPPHESAFTMTVHKSQGSELDRVALILPREPSPILTRELVYTGISRARERVDLYGSEAVLRAALARRVERASGLRQALSTSTA